MDRLFTCELTLIRYHFSAQKTVEYTKNSPKTADTAEKGYLLYSTAIREFTSAFLQAHRAGVQLPFQYEEAGVFGVVPETRGVRGPSSGGPRATGNTQHKLSISFPSSHTVLLFAICAIALYILPT